MIEFIKGYFVDEQGLIYNSRGNILKPSLTQSGYHKIEVRPSVNVKINVWVHRVVALAYLGNPNNMPVVNHKDGNKVNNILSNLEWVSHRDNMIHARSTGLIDNIKLLQEHGLKFGGNNKPKAIEQIDLNGNIIKEFMSVKEAKRVTGWQISGVLSGRYKTVKGYVFRYKSE